MFGQFTDMPNLGNYERALAHHNAIKPIRGRKEDVRPLCNTTTGRRKTHLRIRETLYRGLPAVACRYYDTDVVTYVSDGRVVVSNEYPSNSTNAFASDMLPYALGMARKHNSAWVYDRKGKAYWVPDGEVLELKQRDDMSWYPVEAFVCYKHVVDRRALREATNQYKPFMDNCINVAKLLGEDASKGTFYPKKPTASVLRDPEREGWGEATKYFIELSIVRRFAYPGSGGLRQVSDLKVSTLKRRLSDYVKTEHADIVFEKVAVPIGEFVKDANAKYIGASN